MSVRGVGGKRPARAPELGRNNRVAAQCTPRAVECFSDARSEIRGRHERQGKGVIVRSLVDAAREEMISALKDPAKQTSSGFAWGARSSHAGNKFNRCAS